MPTYTTNYTLAKPLVNSAVDQDLWGTELNTDIDSIDTLLKSGITIAPQSSQITGFTATSSISVKYLYPCNATGGAFAATLPAAATAGNGATVFIKKTDSSANAITVTRSGADTIDDDTTYVIEIEQQCNGFVSDGVSKWYVLTEGVAVVPDASTTVKGIVELATTAETQAQTDSARAVTPSGLAGLLPRAWKTFSGSGSISNLSASGITITMVRNSTGNYTGTLGSALTANFAVIASGRRTDGSKHDGQLQAVYKTTTTFDIYTSDGSTSAADWDYISVLILSA